MTLSKLKFLVKLFYTIELENEPDNTSWDKKVDSPIPNWDGNLT